MDRQLIVHEALILLDETGLDGFSTRQLARRLGVEQPALYWHFKSKTALLEAMACAALSGHTQKPLPVQGRSWRPWFLNNARSLREALLAYRDGARLHAGSRPSAEDAHRLEHKITFLTGSGFREQDAIMALLGVSRFTVGAVLEQQADEERERLVPGLLEGTGRGIPSHQAAFEAGLAMLAGGFGKIRCRTDSRPCLQSH